MITCSFCNIDRDTEKAFMSNVRLSHKELMNFEVTCIHFNCERKFQNIHGYKQHYIREYCIGDLNSIEKNHSDNEKNSIAIQIDEDEPTEENDNNESDFNEEISNCISILEHSLNDLQQFKESVHKYVGLIVAKIYAKPKTPRSSARETIDMFIGFFNSLVVKLIFSKCKENDIEIMCRMVNNTFNTFKSEHLTFQYFKTNNWLIEPRSITINFSNSFRTSKGECLPVILRDTVHLVLPIDVLTKFLEMPNVLEKIFQHVKNCKNSTSMNSIFKSKTYERLEKIYENKYFMPVVVYSDDFEINNPIGSRRVKNKIGAVYQTIYGLPPEYASQLQNIFLLQLHKYIDHRDLGNKKIFNSIIKYLQVLQDEGILVKFNDTTIRIYFPLYAILGDNLGLNTILGYSKGSNSNFPCRICTAPKNLVQTMTSENEMYL